MGLDVYLQKCTDIEYATRQEEEYHSICEEIWDRLGKYERLTEQEKDRTRRECEVVAKKLVIIDDEHKSRETIEYVLAQPDMEQYYLVWSG